MVAHAIDYQVKVVRDAKRGRDLHGSTELRDILHSSLGAFSVVTRTALLGTRRRVAARFHPSIYPHVHSCKAA